MIGTIVRRPEKKIPLVYSCPAALREARRVLGEGVVIENVVEAAILAGDVLGEGRHVQVHGPGWIADVERARARLRGSGARAWLVRTVKSR